MSYFNQDETEHQQHKTPVLYQNDCEACAEITGWNMLKGMDEQFKDRMFSANARQNGAYDHVLIQDLI